jgi:hypothetical protein
MDQLLLCSLPSLALMLAHFLESSYFEKKVIADAAIYLIVLYPDFSKMTKPWIYHDL